MTNKFFVFDRDGTLIKYKPYLSEPDEVELAPGAKTLIYNLKINFNTIFLHTNQSGVSRGKFNLDQVLKCNNRMIDLLDFKTRVFKKICIATELEFSDKSYRKPSPLFGNEILNEFNIKKTDLIYVGDNITDLETAYNIGCSAFGIENKLLKKSVNPNKFGFKTFNNLIEMNKYFYD